MAYFECFDPVFYLNDATDVKSIHELQRKSSEKGKEMDEMAEGEISDKSRKKRSTRKCDFV